MTHEGRKQEIMVLLDRHPEMIPVVHEVLKEGLRLDKEGGGTPENMKKLQDFAETLFEKLRQEQEQEEGHCKT